VAEEFPEHCGSSGPPSHQREELEVVDSQLPEEVDSQLPEETVDPFWSPGVALVQDAEDVAMDPMAAQELIGAQGRRVGRLALDRGAEGIMAFRRAVQAPQWMNPLGGLDASSTATFLEGGPSGLPSANLDATEALAAYRQQQDLTGSPSRSPGAAATYVQQLELTAQASSLASPLNLFA
jgi:hypothetical protein